MIADSEELEEMDASEFHARRLNATEVLTPTKGDSFISPVADGTVRIPGGQRLKPPTLIRDETIAKKVFFEENQTNSLLQPNFKTTRRGMTRKLKVTAGRSQ